MKRALLLIIVGALYVLHQDFWFWREARPLVFGFLPIGLFYHACYTVATAIVMWLLIKNVWPSYLEAGWREEEMQDRASDRGVEEGRGDGPTGQAGDASAYRRVAASPRLPIPPLPIPPPRVPSDKGGADQ